MVLYILGAFIQQCNVLRQCCKNAAQWLQLDKHVSSLTSIKPSLERVSVTHNRRLSRTNPNSILGFDRTVNTITTSASCP